jgi:H/ACA ribonucleoprotein complex subunit 4
MKEIKELLNFGIINIDKPSGPTSFSVSNYLLKELKLKKTSHLGTLDPKVTGVLPITLGRACKLAGFFISHNKEYTGILHTHKEQDIKKLQDIINRKFSGKIKQTPPHKSAVKREEREREVYSWTLLEADNEKKNFLFSCKVQGGTYIRKLCSDLGEIIGGAHMAELRRTSAGIFNEEKMYNLNEFKKAVDLYKKGEDKKLKEMILPAKEALLKIMPKINVEKRIKRTLLNGKPLFLGDIINHEEFYKIKEKELFCIFIDNEFIEVAKKVSHSNLVATPLFVYN